MLALTHHVIVRCAALSVGIKNFQAYLVLGDDVVIANSFVADAYKEIMSNLGVSVNLSKSIVSNKIIEFAKLHLTPDLDLSAFGSGLIVQSLRNRSSLISLVTEAIKRNIIS